MLKRKGTRLKGKVLSIDYGKRHVGIATGDFEFKIAFPRVVLFNSGIEGLVKEIVNICNELQVVFIVIGLPLNMRADDFENAIMKDIRLFVEELKKSLETGVEIEFFDERLSSFEADELVSEMANKFGKTEKLEQDAYAAQIVLQRFFDKLSS